VLKNVDHLTRAGWIGDDPREGDLYLPRLHRQGYGSEWLAE
jgi:hypothetical protein